MGAAPSPSGRAGWGIPAGAGRGGSGPYLSRGGAGGAEGNECALFPLPPPTRGSERFIPAAALRSRQLRAPSWVRLKQQVQNPRRGPAAPPGRASLPDRPIALPEGVPCGWRVPAAGGGPAAAPNPPTCPHLTMVAAEREGGRPPGPHYHNLPGNSLRRRALIG